MRVPMQLLFFLTIFHVATGNDVETRLELLEKQLNEVLGREAQTKRDNEEQSKALHDMTAMVKELQTTVARQQSHILELQSTVSQQADRITALESEGVDTEQGEALNDATHMHGTPKSDMCNGGRTIRSGIFSRRQTPEMLIAFSAVKVDTQYNIGVNQNIIFENAILNQGNGFHSYNGVFVAPQTGVYLITSSLAHREQSFTLHAAIIHDGKTVAKFHGNNEWEQFSQTVIITVNAGEEVYVRNIDDAQRIIYGESFSTFSGFLLWQI